jgi:hypothetical protein
VLLLTVVRNRLPPRRHSPDSLESRLLDSNLVAVRGTRFPLQDKNTVLVGEKNTSKSGKDKENF